MVSKEDVDRVTKGEGLVSRLKYRKGASGISAGKMVISKKENYQKKELLAENLGENLKNPEFGFQCLHYSVSEAAGRIQIPILNKTRGECKVRVKTLGNTDTDLATATPDEDYKSLDILLEFKKGQGVKTIEVEILDDDEWEPDEDFFVQLYKEGSNEELTGRDARTKITIIDDDKPGMIIFKDKETIKAPATRQYVKIDLERIKGSDGRITVEYETVEIDGGAKAGIDFVP